MADSLIPDLSDLFPDMLVYTPTTSVDGRGTMTPGTPVNIQASVVGKVRNVAMPDGQLQISSVQAHLAGVFGVTVQGKFTLPVRFVPRSPKPLAVDHATDENGAHHEVVYFQ